MVLLLAWMRQSIVAEYCGPEWSRAVRLLVGRRELGGGLFLQIGPTPTCQSTMQLINGSYPVTCHQRYQLGTELSIHWGHLTPTALSMLTPLQRCDIAGG